MRYPFNPPGFRPGALAVELRHPFTEAQLLQGGQPAPKGTAKKTFLLRADDGREVVATLKTGRVLLDPLPRILIDGTPHDVGPPLRWFEIAACWLPFFLILTGGALGGACGGLAVAVNSRILRMGWSPLVTWLALAAVMSSALLGYLLLAVVFRIAFA